MPAESGQVGKEHMAGVSDDGIATGNGSRPSLQWWIATPFESLVPSFVPKSVVTVGSFGGRLIPIRRVPFHSQLGRCLKRKGKECEFDETN